MGKTTSFEFLIAGLGNPGPEYAQTRHNAGFWVVDALARNARATSFFPKNHGLVAEGSLAGTSILLAKPQTYMNRSGECVGPLAKRYALPPERLLVVHDELDLPEGEIRFKQRGGSGGHNGLKSVTQHLKSDQFMRLRVGIGRPPRGKGADYVLRQLDEEALGIYRTAVEEAVDAVQILVKQGIQRAMNHTNRRQTPSPATTKENHS